MPGYSCDTSTGLNHIFDCEQEYSLVTGFQRLSKVIRGKVWVFKLF
jgi:hypothetical protein